MSLECPCRGELTQLVSNHLFGDVDLEKLVAVVHHEIQTHKFGDDGTIAGPGLDGLTISRLAIFLHLLVEALIDIRTFF